MLLRIVGSKGSIQREGGRGEGGKLSCSLPLQSQCFTTPEAVI